MLLKRKYNKIIDTLLALSKTSLHYSLMLQDRFTMGTPSWTENVNKIVDLINKHKEDLLKYKKANFKITFAQICANLGFHALINENFYNLIDEFFEYESSYYPRSFISNLITTMGYRVYNYDKIVPYCDKYVQERIENKGYTYNDELVVDFEKATKDIPNKVRYVKQYLVEDKVNVYAKYIEMLKEHFDSINPQPTREEIEKAKKNYKREIDFNSEIKTYSNDTDYPLCNKTSFNLDETLKEKSLHEYILEIKKLDIENLASLIVNDANLIALLAYIVKAIDEEKHNSDLNPNIDYLINNVSLIYKENELVNNKVPFIILVKYFTHLYGICYDKDSDFANEYLKAYCSLLKEDADVKPLEILSMLGEKAVVQITSLTHLFETHVSYKELIMNISSPAKVLPYKMLCQYINTFKENRRNYEVVKLIDAIQEIHIKEALEEEFEDIYHRTSGVIIDEWKKRKSAKELEEENLKEKAEIEETILKVKEYLNSLPKIEKEENKPLEQLLKEYDNPISIYSVGKYYFYEAEYDYKLYYKAASYYEKADTYNVKYAKVNAGISYSNISIATKDEKEEAECLQLAIDIFLSEAEKEPVAAIMFMNKAFKSSKDYGDIADKLYNLHMANKDLSDNIKLWLQISYLFYKGKALDSVTLLKNNLVKAWHRTFLDHYIISIFNFLDKKNQANYGYKVANGKSVIVTSYDIDDIKKMFTIISHVVMEFEPLKQKYNYANYIYRAHPIVKYNVRLAYEYSKYAYENNPKDEKYENLYNAYKEILLIK